MAYIELQTQGDKRYYYVTKNFRIGVNKWKKIRKYCGEEKPSKDEFKQVLDGIDLEAKKLGFLKAKSSYRFLSDKEAEVLEDVRQEYVKWYGRLDKVSRKKYDDDFLVRFTYNTNAIEGNRMSLRETSMLISEDLIPSGVSTKDINEALNGRDCLEYVRGYQGNLGKKFLLRVHEILTRNTGCRITGRFRDSEVRISGSDWVPPQAEKVEEEIGRMLSWWRNNQKILHPAETAGVVHNTLVRIHPFTDGNGRTARVIMNWILQKKGYPMFYIENREKQKYYQAIEAGDGGNDKEFINYLAETLVKQHTITRS
jgi:Fic family protein